MKKTIIHFILMNGVFYALLFCGESFIAKISDILKLNVNALDGNLIKFQKSSNIYIIQYLMEVDGFTK